MPSATLLRAGWKMMPDRRTVTFKRRTATTPTYTTYSVEEAWYRPDLTGEGEPSQGVYVRRYRRWYLVKEKLNNGTIVPMPGDVVTAAATNIDLVASDWTVLTMTEAGALGAYELACVRAEVVSALAVTVTQQRRTGAQDATGRMLPDTADVTSGSGWFQAEGSDTVPDLLMKTQLPVKGTIYLAVGWDVRATDTALVGSTSYNVDGMESPNRLDELYTLRVSLAR